MESSISSRIAALDVQQKKMLARRMAATAAAPNLHFPFPRWSAEPPPASYSQERLLIAHEVDPQNARYNTFFALRLEGSLRHADLANAVRQLVLRHAVLRTTFELRHGSAVQLIHEGCPLVERIVDIAGVLEAETLAGHLARQETQRPFDLIAGPVVRSLLIRVRERLHVFVLTVHHIASDRWSAQILGRELLSFYEKGAAAAAQPPLRFQYADFAAWQRLRVQENLLQPQIDYWRAQLSAPPPPLHLGRSARARSSTGHGERISQPLPGALVQALESAGKRCEATLFMTALAAFAVLLRRAAGEQDLLIGVPITNRSTLELQSLVGFFLNTLLMRIPVSDRVSFLELLRQVRRTCIEAMANAEVPFEVVCQSCGLHQHAREATAYQVLFTLNDIHDPLPAAPATTLRGRGALQVSPLFPEVGGIPAGLALHVEHNASRTTCLLEYDTQVLNSAEARQLLDSYVNVLKSLAALPEQPIGRISLADLEQSCNEAGSWNRTVTEFPRHARIDELFRETVLESPLKTAIEAGARHISYRDLDQQSQRLAMRLRAQGVGIDDRVGVLLERSAEFIVAALAVVKAGAAYVPLDPREPLSRLGKMIEDSAIALIVTRHSHVELAWRSWSGVAVVDVADCQHNAPESSALSSESRTEAADSTAPAALIGGASPAQLAYVIYTSGSTGRPKGVAVPHSAVVRLVRATNYAPLSKDDRIGHVSNIAFDAATFEIWGSLLNGGTLVFLEYEDLFARVRLGGGLADLRLTALFVTTALFNQIARIAPTAFAGIDRLLFGGERCDPELVSAVARARRPLPTLHVYGPTECTTFSTFFPVATGDADSSSIPIGRPLSNTSCYVLDACMQPVPPHLAGELYIGGEGLARGYQGNPSLSAERFLPDPFSGASGGRMYRTGDLVSRLPSGDIDFIGRLDNQVKLRGFRIELGEVRDALRHVLPGVEVQVTLREGREGHARLVAYLQAEQSIDPQPLREQIKKHLPEYMIPSAFVCLSRLPLTPNGKIDFAQLPEPALDEEGYVAPQSPAEEVLARIWEQALGIERVSVNADFFGVGGNSLLALKIVAEVRERLGVDLTLRTFFESSTIAKLSRALEACRSDAPPTPQAVERLVPHPEDRFQPFPLTSLQRAYWIGRTHSLDLGKVSAHAYFELDLPELQVSRLADALNRLIQRHDALRTVVRPDGQQQALPEVPRYRIATADLSGLQEPSAQEALQAIRRRMSHQVIPSDRWPLFEFRASKLSSGSTRLHVSIDALISDAWSWRIMIGELANLYGDPRRELPRLELTFRDYVMYRLGQRSSSAYERAQQYWLERLQNFPSAPALPVLQDNGASARFGRRAVHLDASSWQGLREAATHAGVTPSIAVLAAFAEVITFWSANERYVLNITSFDRTLTHPDVGSVVGDFTSLVLLEVAHNHQCSFAQRAASLQRQLWRDLDHRDVDGVTVMQELRRHRGGEQVIFPVVFTSLLGLPKLQSATGLPRATCAFSISQTPQVWLDCQVYEDASGLAVSWDCLEAIFPAGLLDDLFAAFTSLLERLVARGAWQESRLARLPRWQHELFQQVNATAAPVSEQLLHAEFFRQARRSPERPAVISDSAVVRYGELAKRAEALAAEVRRLSSRGRELVAIVMEKGWEQVAAVLGILQGGFAYLPIDPQLPRKRIEFLLSHGAVDLVLTQSWTKVDWPAGITVLNVDTFAMQAAEIPEAAPAAGGNRNLAYVIFTSGSTGEPKGVMISHCSALNTVLDLNERFRLGCEDRVLALSSLSFDLSVYDIFGPLSAGGAIVMPDFRAAIDPTHWQQLACSHGVTVWSSVPALMDMFHEHLKKSGEGLPRSLRLVMLSGDWIPLSLACELLRVDRAPQLVSLGGATEAAIWSIFFDITDIDPQWPSIPYGKPLRNQRFRVLDAGMRSRPVWVPGSLCIEGEGLALGYWKDVDKTSQKFKHHPDDGVRLYMTGDLGRYLPDGNIQFLGREDTQVKVAGYRIELGEIESQLSRHPQVIRCLVLVGEGDGSARHLVAFVCLQSGDSPSERALREFLAESLPQYMVPRAFVCCDDFPLTVNGKVDRKRLWAMYRERTQTPRGDGAQESSLERILCDIFAAQLNLPGVAAEDNFFTLGGQSLAALRILTQIKEKTGADLPLRVLFRAPTPRELAAEIASSSMGSERVPVGDYEVGLI